ncbi:MAG: CHAT domain-containing protein [Gammaproteobacteria bacterium]|nr:CHAT domain-containing protein [Gammaproteobacteria bacterium]
MTGYGIFLVFVSGQTYSDSAAGDAIAIQLNETRGDIQGAEESITYLFNGRLGDIYVIELVQSGLDFLVTVEGPDGTSQSFNSPLRRDEREFVLLEPKVSGDYRITVDSEESTNARGEHTLRITQAQTNTVEERRYVEAMRLMSMAAAIYDPEDRASSLKAKDLYSDAQKMWKHLGKAREHAQALYSTAMLEYWAAYQWSRSARLAQEASVIYKDLGLELLYANAIHLQGAALIEGANEPETVDAQTTFETALELLNFAQNMHQQLGNGFELAHLSNNIGLTYFYMGDWDRARTSWVEAANQFRELNEWREELNALQNQAVIDGLQGYNAKVIETLQYIVDALPKDRDPQFRATVMNNLAENHRLFGNYEKALQTYSAALSIESRIGDHIGEGYSLIGLGNTYYSIGELDLASTYLEQALPWAKESNDGRSHTAILARLGDIHFLRSEYDLALERHLAALELSVADHPDYAHRQLSVAKDRFAMNQLEEAHNLATDAADLAEKSESLATYANAIMQIGRIETTRGNPSSAQSYFESALSIYETLGLKRGQADAFNGLASAARLLGELDKAVRYSQESLHSVESLRERVAAPELRAYYSAASRRYYETQIDILMARSAASTPDSEEFVRAALTTSESARGRMTMDLLREASVDLRSHVDSELLDEERELFEELAAKAQQRDGLVEQRVLDTEKRRKLSILDENMSDLENRLHVVRSALRRSDPAYLRISPTESIRVEDFQRLLDQDTILLQYSFGNDRSFVWAVTRDSLDAIELADRNSVQQASLAVLGNINALESSQDNQRRLDQDLRRLATYVLHPLAQHLGSKSRLLVVPDGALEYIPFAVLPAANDPDARLIETHEIVTLPSMSVVMALRARGAAEPEKTIAVFADPVVEARDPRLGNMQTQSHPVVSLPADPLIRSTVSLGRLPSTADEAKAIAALVPESERYLALGFDANRDQVMSMDLTRYRYLHFATHGIVDARYPALSSLVLSQFDEKGNGREGLLRLYDIFDLELNANLVVLSACNTALGRQIRGEGLMGLAQGFMYAGARSLLVSLWQVPDRATAELMARFYENMFDANEPYAPAAALRKAQLTLAENRRWSHPYYWGAFVLLGDWQ